METENPMLNPPLPKSGESTRKKASAKLRNLVKEMGLRFRPTSQAELAFHSDKLDLLIDDLVDIPDALLERAIPELCRE